MGFTAEGETKSASLETDTDSKRPSIQKDF
jgi:hypothetical protein